ncbi:hypothetical protein [Marinomonas foliarum]|uniref:hypothetical protein n=1 Tax=Marinomonas foliarum TaxID=491950 RepID=UPI000DF48AD1|nr:hypothetical protein [Marinomonas foliarum]
MGEKTFMEKGFNPDFHLGAWSKPNTTARHCRLTSLWRLFCSPLLNINTQNVGHDERSVICRESEAFFLWAKKPSWKKALTLTFTLALGANQTPPLDTVV